MRANQVYQNSTMLDIGSQAWTFARAFTITADDVTAGHIPVKSFNFTKNCSGGMSWNFYCFTVEIIMVFRYPGWWYILGMHLRQGVLMLNLIPYPENRC